MNKTVFHDLCSDVNVTFMTIKNAFLIHYHQELLKPEPKTQFIWTLLVPLNFVFSKTFAVIIINSHISCQTVALLSVLHLFGRCLMFKFLKCIPSKILWYMFINSKEK